MEAKRVILAMFLGIAVMNLSRQVSARLLLPDVGTKSPQQGSKVGFASGEHDDDNILPASYSATEYQNLDEIDRMKLSISKLICGTMEEGCDHMDDASDRSESFESLNPHDHVMGH